jgi:hypothetical protein
VIVQALDDALPRVLGLHVNEETCTGAVKLMLAVADVLL